MAFISNPKRRIGISLMALGFLALIGSDAFRPLRWWFQGVFFVAFLSGLILNYIEWKEEKREQLSR